MKHLFFKTFIILATLLLTITTVMASVSVSLPAAAPRNSITIAGNKSFYPIEYYNSTTKDYDGILPAIFKKISTDTGLNFVYIHSDSLSQSTLANDGRVAIVSAYITDADEKYAKDCINIFSYNLHGQQINVGLAFTDIADDHTIKMIKNSLSSLTAEDLNGLFINKSISDRNKKEWFAISVILFAVFFCIIAVFVAFWHRNAKKQLQITDEETGIGNLLYFENNLKRLFYEKYQNYYVAYIIADSNSLQIYHPEISFTDALKYAAGVINMAQQENEFVARISENGFAVALHCYNESEAIARADELIRNFNRMNSDEYSFESNKPVFYVSLCKLEELEKSCELLLFNLRRNCNKIIGSNKQSVFCDYHTMNSVSEEKQLTQSIIRAFENKEFKLFLQFVVENKTGKIVSAEALSRWDSSDQGLILPSKYIPVMEQANLISQLDIYMFEEVCKQLHKWNNTEFGNISISCNFTRITLSETDLFSKLSIIADKYVFDKSRLIIEITEDSLEKNRNIAISNIHACKNAGFRIALDDMGNGYTAMSNLCDYPIDVVKIDRDILTKIEQKRGKELFDGMIALATALISKLYARVWKPKNKMNLSGFRSVIIFRAGTILKPFLPMTVYG